MVLYRRNWVPGGAYFFTVTLRDRSSGLLVQYIDHLRHAFRTTHRERPFRLEAIVILPDHLHTLWTLPTGDADYAGRWRALKSRFTQALRLQASVAWMERSLRMKPVGWVERSGTERNPSSAGSCDNDEFHGATLCSTHPTTMQPP